MAFFGRLPSRDDGGIALVGVASLTWVSLVAAVGLTIIGPLGIGGVVATMHNNRHGTTMTSLRYVLSGYVCAAVIGPTAIAIVITVPIRKASYIV